MPKPEKLYYKKPTVDKKGEVHFNNQILVIKTPHLERITKLGIQDYANAETHSMIRRMAVSFIADEDYNLAREEINFSNAIPKRDTNDYITIFSGTNQMIVMLKPASTRQRTIIEFETWEAEQAQKLADENKRIEAELEKQKQDMGL